MDLGWFETSLDVQDIVKSVAFYETLGFRHVEGDIAVRTVTLNRGDCRLTLFQGHLDPARTQLIFWQGDVEAIAREATAKGFVFQRGPNVSKDGASAMLFDPDGHPLFFINMPVHFINDPAYARPAPPSRPRADNEDDMVLGRFVLSLPVSDIQRSLSFYERLGFARYDKGDDARTATLYNRDCRIGLFQGYLDPPEPQLIFWQGDVEAIGRDLIARGIQFEREPVRDENGVGWMLFDPDRHPIYFVNIRSSARTA
jgi:catechol 2,3-dioxygenase-like lactoylglutathione lyase family enzyme